MYAVTTSAGETPLAPNDWTLSVAAEVLLAPALETPCKSACNATQVCVVIDAATHCKSADLIADCEPRCDSGQVCVGGQCRRIARPLAGTQPWRDDFAGDSAIALWGDERLIAYHNHAQGSLHLSRAAPQQKFETVLLDGGSGLDVGHHVALVADAGLIAVAYVDATHARVKLLIGSHPQSLSASVLGRGGAGLAMVAGVGGQVSIAYGQASMDVVHVVQGSAGALQHFQIAQVSAVGRFNAWIRDGGGLVLGTLRDHFSADLQLEPQVLLFDVSNP
jgi:hypothetical protein